MEWVKLHLDWADGLEALSDEDDQIDEAAAGRWILGLLHYVRTGEKPQLSGPEKVLFAMAVADLKKDYAFLEKQAADAEAKRQAVSEARREAANARWGKGEMQTDANACTSMQEQSKHEQPEQNAAIRSKNKEQDIKNTDTDIERDKEKNKKRKRENAKSGRAKDVTEAQYDQRPNTEPDGYGKPRWLIEAQNKRREQAGKQKTVTEAQYYQRPNTEPDGDAVPQWLTDYEETEITGYSDPAGNQDAPDRPDIHGEE